MFEEKVGAYLTYFTIDLDPAQREIIKCTSCIIKENSYKLTFLLPLCYTRLYNLVLHSRTTCPATLDFSFFLKHVLSLYFSLSLHILSGKLFHYSLELPAFSNFYSFKIQFRCPCESFPHCIHFCHKLPHTKLWRSEVQNQVVSRATWRV